MSDVITAAWIGLAGGILAAWAAKVPVEDLFSLWSRKRDNIPQIMKTRWQVDWHTEDGVLYVSDQVTFEKWTKNSRFVGYGEVTHDNRQYKYSLEGEVSPRGIVGFSYKAEKYPTEASFGTACLELSDNALELQGIWSGRLSKELEGKKYATIRGGEVRMKKIKDL